MRRPSQGGQGAGKLAIAAGLLAVVTVLALWLMSRPKGLSHTLRPVAVAEVLPSGTGRAFGRYSVDPANRVSRTGIAVERAKFRRLDLSRPADLNFEDIQDFLGWQHGYGGESKFGTAVAKCRIDYHRDSIAEGEGCDLRQRIFIEDADEGASVVEVESLYDDETTSLTCKRWSRCVREAWLGRDAPGEGGFVEMEVTPYVPEFGDAVGPKMTDRGYLALHEESVKALQEKNDKRWEYIKEQESLGSWSQNHRNSLYANHKNTGLWIDDFNEIVRLLDEGYASGN